MKKARWLWLLLPLIAGVLWMRSLASWRPKVIFAGAGEVSELVFSDDGQTLLVAQKPPKTQSASATLTALDVRDLSSLWQREAPNDFGHPQFFANDSRVLVDTGQVMILNARDGQSVREFDFCCGAAVSPSGKWIANGDFDADGRVFLNSPDADISNGSQGISGVHVLGRREDSARAFAFAPDGQTFVVGRGDKTGAYLDFYDVRTWKRARSLPEPEVARERAAQPRLAPALDLPFFRSIRWSRDGQLILYKAVAGGASNLSVTRLRRAADGKSLGLLLGKELTPQPRNDGNVLRIFSNSDVALVKPPQFNTRFEPSLQLPGEVFTTAILSPDGNLLLVGTQSGRVIRKRLK